MTYKIVKQKDGSTYCEVSVSGFNLLSYPLLNKGMAFTEEERTLFKLHGLIPPNHLSIEEQKKRSYITFSSKTSDLEKYIYLQDLQSSNETLFYALVTEHLEEMMPIIYTPTVGEACAQFGQIYRRPRGLFISYPNQDRIEEILSNPRFNNVEAIVVTDGERILGLGDLSAGGMGIPIGKLSLYTACGGIHPSSTLPILLDTGTDNETLLKHPFYPGWRHRRIRGKEYDDFIETFVSAVEKRFPSALLQWEDFAKCNATPLLHRYKDRLCSFNDDIQGTAAVAVGTLLAAVRVSGIPLTNQKIVIVGGGSAGCGIARLILQAMQAEGLPQEEVKKKFFIVDALGLITDKTPSLLPFQQEFLHPVDSLSQWVCEQPGFFSLKDVVHNLHPTLLIGVSGQKGLFTKEIIQEMASHVEKPIIFPLSNPTSYAEATPEDLLGWTQGRAIIGTGSPFPPVSKGSNPSFKVDQTNNAYIFPGLALGVLAIKIPRITDDLFMAAAQTLASSSPSQIDPEKNLLPPLKEIRELSFTIACAVGKKAVDKGLIEPLSSDQIEKKVKEKMWDPSYIPYKKMSEQPG